jgi:hypothetical protein
LQFSPSNRPRPANNNAGPRYSQPPLKINESTLPLEVMRHGSHRKPLDRGLLVGGVCFLLIGIVPTVAYFAPPVEDHDALSNPGRHASSMPPAQATVQPPAAPLADTSVLEAEASAAGVTRAALLDPEATPPQGQPLLPAQPELAKPELAKPELTNLEPAPDSEPSAPPRAAAASTPAKKPARRTTKAAQVSAVRSQTPAPSTRRTPSSSAREPAYKPQASGSKLPWEK